MTCKPKFITFTGVDDYTSITQMQQLSNKYPVEWGILFSKSRQGSGRYPSLETVQDFMFVSDTSFDFNLSAHICGEYSNTLQDKLDFYADELSFVEEFDSFRRIQINTTRTDTNIKSLDRLVSPRMKQLILQCRQSEFPINYNSSYVSYLYDCSGGRGTLPNSWPKHSDENTFVGYAGGINPDNVLNVLDSIECGSGFWIDMESGVRDNNDRFDIEKCKIVCEKVYGK